MQDTNTALSQIRHLAEQALLEPGSPPSVTKALRDVVALTLAGPGDTPEPSDPPNTENQTL